MIQADQLQKIVIPTARILPYLDSFLATHVSTPSNVRFLAKTRPVSLQITEYIACSFDQLFAENAKTEMTLKGIKIPHLCLLWVFSVCVTECKPSRS